MAAHRVHHLVHITADTGTTTTIPSRRLPMLTTRRQCRIIPHIRLMRQGSRMLPTVQEMSTLRPRKPARRHSEKQGKEMYGGLATVDVSLNDTFQTPYIRFLLSSFFFKNMPESSSFRVPGSGEFVSHPTHLVPCRWTRSQFTKE